MGELVLIDLNKDGSTEINVKPFWCAPPKEMMQPMREYTPNDIGTRSTRCGTSAISRARPASNDGCDSSGDGLLHNSWADIVHVGVDASRG